MSLLKAIPIITLFLFIGFLSCKKEADRSPVRSCCNTEPLVDSIGSTKFFIPNVFTADRNGANDRLFVYGDIKEISLMQVIDSHGNLVFERENFVNFPDGWDGKVNGEEKAGLYFYKITILSNDDVVKNVEGQICCLPCKESMKFPTFDNIDNCVFGLQHDGAGSYNLNNSTGEVLECLD